MKQESVRVAESSEGPSALNIPVKAPASYNTVPTSGIIEQDDDYQEGLTGKAFQQLDSLKRRIERQQVSDANKKKKQFAKVTEAMQQTQLMRDVEQEREILRLQEERLHEEAKTNPDVLLSPRAMALKCIDKHNNFKQLFEEYKEKDEYFTEDMNEEINYAMTRQEVLGVPMFKQDFAFRLVKLNQIENTMWGTEFIRRV